MAAALAGATASLFLGAGAASAHHGFTGRYDASEPLYVQGTVRSATYGYPHGLIEIDPGPPQGAPADLTDLSAEEAENLGGLEVVTDAAPVETSGEGQLTLLLPPPMTTEVADRSDRPEAGDDVGAVVYRECTTGELRVQLLRISADDRVVRSGVMQTEVDGCAGDEPSASSAGTANETPQQSLPGREAEPVQVSAHEEDQGAPFGFVVAAALAVAAASGLLAVVTARRARSTSSTSSSPNRRDAP